MDELLLEIVKGAVALIVGLTAGLAVAGMTSKRNADLEREKWQAELDLEREKTRADDERRWHTERRRVYAEFLAAANSVIPHWARLSGSLATESGRRGEARDISREFDTSAMDIAYREIQLIGGPSAQMAALAVHTTVFFSYGLRLMPFTLGTSSAADDQKLDDAVKELVSRLATFTEEARKDLGLEPESVEEDKRDLERKARELYESL